MSDIGYKEMKYLCDQYLKLPDGEEHAEAVRYAIKRSDELGIQEWRLIHRHNLIYQLCLWGDEGELLPLLSEFVTVFEEQPMTKYVSHYLYALCRSLLQWECFSNLPLEEFDKVAEHFLEACKRYDGNMFEYYDVMYAQCRYEGKMEEAKEYQKKALATFRKSYRFSISPCVACKQYKKVRYALDDKEWKRAMKEAKPLLDGRMSCNQHPKGILDELQDFALDHGNWEDAKYCMERLEALEKPDWDDHSWSGMRYYAFADLEKGLEIFRKCADYVLKLHNQSGKRAFYEDAYVFWTQYAKKYTEVSLELPKSFSFYQENGIYEPKALAHWFYEEALAIAKRFDDRNGYPFFQQNVLDKTRGMEKMEQNEDYLAEMQK